MGAWEQALGGTSPGIVHRLEISEISTNAGANTSVVRISHYARTQSGTRSGTYDANEVLDGTTRRSVANVGYSWNTGNTLLFSGDYTIGHDSNGNKTVSGSAYLDYAFANGTINGSEALTRLPLAPTIGTFSADLMTVTSARMFEEESSWGHGAPGGTTFYYRINGSGSGYTSTGEIPDTGGDKGGGYTSAYATNLRPGTTYDYYCVVRNGMNDTVTSSVQTFTTLPAPNTSAALLAIVGVL